MDLNKLTGQGNDFNIDGGRKNAQERATERLEGTDVDAVRKKVTDNMDVPTGGN